jgi:Na+/H+-dicarboxylate symporter
MLAVILGVQISFLQLLFSLPVIFILGYAVPGIPGELVIFAGSMGILLGIPADTLPLFLALYLTMQIGLPDSFRTGCNSTDSALLAIISATKLEQYQKQKAV